MPLADELLGPTQVRALAAVLDRAQSADTSAVRSLADQLGPLTLSGRVMAVRDELAVLIPTARELDRTLTKALPDPALTGWMIWPVTEWVTLLTAGDPAAFAGGLHWLRRLTGRLTAEFAIRGFLLADLDRTLEILAGWVQDPDEHVRRLVSEGTRQRLPWGRRVPALTARPEATLPLLDALVDDESEYVRRSVANHLNDLSRSAPQTAVEVAGRWLAEPTSTTEAVVRHALRTLVKQGDPEALSLLGYGTAGQIEVSGPTLAGTRVDFPGALEFTVRVRNTGITAAALVIDHVVHYVKANGSRSAKVFKLTTVTLEPGETREFSRSVAFRPLTTRRHHPGRHALEIQVNGSRSGLVEFDLLLD